METPQVSITRKNHTSSRVRIDAQFADSLNSFLYKKSLAITPVESRPQPTIRIVKTDVGTIELRKEEFGAAFNVTATA